MAKYCGTFDFCVGCDDNQNCCTGKYVDLPILTHFEIETISSKYRINPTEFLDQKIGAISQVKSTSKGCYFYKENKCMIYNDRPLDCRLYPFDLRRNGDGDIDLVLYTDTCPEGITIDVMPYSKQILENIKSIVPTDLSLDDYVSDGWLTLLHNRQFTVIKRAVHF